MTADCPPGEAYDALVAGGFGSMMASAGLSVPVVAAALAGWVVLPAAVAARLLGRRRV